MKPYAVLSIPLLCLAVYLATWLLQRFGVISNSSLRKFWNSVLLIAFLGAAGLGFLLAIQVNLKIDLPAAASFLLWHVDFGIGLLSIALIHLIRHLRYFRDLIFPRRESPDRSGGNHDAVRQQGRNEVTSEIRSGILLPFILGFTAMASQIILLREFMSLFQGNELSIAIVLANWMLLTGLGAWLGRKGKQSGISLRPVLSGIAILSVLAPVTLFTADLLKVVIFPSGTLVGLGGIFLSALVLLAPFCLLSGFLFTRITGRLSSPDANTPATVYSLESLGSMAGGMLVNLVLIFLLKPFYSMLAVVLLSLFLTAIVAHRNKLARLNRALIPVMFLFTLVMISVNPDRLSRKMLFPGQEIEYYRNTPYGSLLVTRSAEQRNFFGNTSLLFTTNDVISNEEAIHYALLQRPSPKNVMLVEGGISGTLKEILKYPVEKVKYVELNPWIIRLGRKYTKELSDQRVSLCQGDVLNFLRRETVLQDAILLQVPEPSSLMVNRFYTLEFFKLVRSKLKPGGVCSVGLMPTPNYVGDEARQVQSVMLSTLKKVFPTVILIPGEKNYFLASTGPLDTGVAGLQEIRGIPTEYVNSYYLDDTIIRARSKEITGALSNTAEINQDFKPLLFFGQIRYWLSYFGKPSALFLLLPLLLFFLLVWGLHARPVNTGVMVTGFTASSVEILLLFVFQVLFGNLYLMAGLIILVFMAGLYLGAGRFGKRFRVSSAHNLVRVQMLIALVCLMILDAVAGFTVIALPSWLIQACILLLILIISVITGIQYRVSALVLAGEPQHVSGSLYSADLLGSATGTLLVSVWLTPLLGIQGTLLALAGLNILTAIWLNLRLKKVSLK